VRGRAGRRRLPTSEENSSASPEPMPERRMTDVRHSSYISPGNITATPAGYNVVNGNGTPPVVSPVKEVGRVLTVTELAMKIIPILSTLKAEMANIQLAISELPGLGLAVKELKEGFIEMERKSAVFDIKLVQTDLALKSLNKSSLVFESSKIPLEVRKPPSILKCLPWSVVVLMM